MDNPRYSWAPQRALVLTGWLLAAVAAAATVVMARTADRAGALLLGVAALALVLAAAHGTLVRPRLTADAGGLRVRTLGGTRRLDWPRARFRLATTRRLGRDVTVLEVEADELVVLGRIELGTDPRDVLDVLAELRARAY
ncbi:PH domain-containing protein [Amycolatopsis arida]|uniref:PH domain-containing protein n=1 Tax=Amycolatopsis arida TaxID=587909 RepID=A0A1I5TV68_9PSEU|nr:PH domain-containing protein [Amycolatopsis arida]TDX95955.1 PH (Pleckstrin Homology) domain-containing protein [Amycolatopsis arida]SFP86909.1 PH domain-containing protein [Amycolatopsis arida]